MNFNNFIENMTLFYSKRNGNIQNFCTGIQDMNFFGESKEDYEIIWDFIVVPYNELVLSNKDMFYIDLETKQVKTKNITI